MQVFMFTALIPEHTWENRTIEFIGEKDRSILYWTVKELNSYFSGEFDWNRLGLFGICAIQYVNRYTVRFIVYAKSKELALSMVKSRAWQMDQKKRHRRKYGPRKPKSSVATAIA